MSEQTQLFPAEVTAQGAANPVMYGAVDFSRLPERYTEEIEPGHAVGSFTRHLPSLLENREQVELIRTYTMMGDRVADAYAALIPDFGFKRLVEMLELACDKGVQAVEGAPEELKIFIAAMEEKPQWLDMDLVEEGARLERNSAAHAAPYFIRGALLATYMNKYSALPMAMTGTLSGGQAAKRAFETASFFATTVMPGALDRFREGFKAAAKVRLMHSMVRYHLLRSDDWDTGVYGIPVPQVDQMPAGLINIFLLSAMVLREGRTEFTPTERARVEMARYRCFLLGLPEALVGTTPQEIIDLLLTRHITLRPGYDDATCGELVRATMQAELSADKSPLGRLKTGMERGISKFFFVSSFCQGDFARAEEIGVPVTRADRVMAGLGAATIFLRIRFFGFAARNKWLKGWADKVLVRKLAKRLASYGHPEFETDAAKYRIASASS
jgi:hypothetical protein